MTSEKKYQKINIKNAIKMINNILDFLNDIDILYYIDILDIGIIAKTLLILYH